MLKTLEVDIERTATKSSANSIRSSLRQGGDAVSANAGGAGGEEVAPRSEGGSATRRKSRRRR